VQLGQRVVLVVKLEWSVRELSGSTRASRSEEAVTSVSGATATHDNKAEEFQQL
jgi:hypothetical protein